MGNMLVPPLINGLVEYQSDVIQGTWKFHPNGNGRTGVTFEGLSQIGHKLQVVNPGNGEFINLSIIEAANGEYGLCMTYKMSKSEANHAIDTEAQDHFLDKYIDFFLREAGLAYKGHEGFRSHVAIVRPQRQEEIDQVV